ncbi:MAG: DUF3829 domain-containing protein [Comamonadaceae bacterium]|nr:MAG: DUF3829 domain-containing protein [Comamonadaceae bacterium]
MQKNIANEVSTSLASPVHPLRKAPRAASLALMALAASAALVLSACKDDQPAKSGAAASTSPAAGSSVTAAAPGKSADASQDSVAKLNAYTEAYNKIIGTFGLPETRDRYYKANIPAKRATDSVSISDGWVDIALEQFKKGRALPAGGFGELDKAADQLIAALDKLVVELKDLDVYYTSKAYKDDNLAKGKAKDAEVRGHFEASLGALKNFNDILSAEQKKRDTAMLAKLKDSGDLLGYSTKLALQQGEELISLFGDENDISNPAKYTQGDTIVASLESTLADQRKQYAAAKDKQPSPDSGHESAGSRLVSLVGSYRDLKQSKKASDYNSMVKNYNSAVESANRISR